MATYRDICAWICPETMKRNTETRVMGVANILKFIDHLFVIFGTGATVNTFGKFLYLKIVNTIAYEWVFTRFSSETWIKA
jgi:hypothetical protein